MKPTTKSALIGAAIVGALALSLAGAYAFVSNDTRTAEVTKIETKPAVKPKNVAKRSSDTPWREPQVASNAPQPVRAPQCDDGNIAGVGVGAVAGGLLGNQIGKGQGRKLATVGGAIAGGYVGQQVVPLNNVTCR